MHVPPKLWVSHHSLPYLLSDRRTFLLSLHVTSELSPLERPLGGLGAMRAVVQATLSNLIPAFSSLGSLAGALPPLSSLMYFSFPWLLLFCQDLSYWAVIAFYSVGSWSQSKFRTYLYYCCLYDFGWHHATFPLPEENSWLMYAKLTWAHAQ